MTDERTTSSTTTGTSGDGDTSAESRSSGAAALLREACKVNDIRRVRQVLQHHASSHAVLKGREGLADINLLLNVNDGGDDDGDDAGATALHFAAQNGNCAIVELLLGCCCTPAHHHRLDNQSAGGAEAMASSRGPAAADGPPCYVGCCCIDVNPQTSPNGYTPLHYAALLGHADVVRALVVHNQSSGKRKGRRRGDGAARCAQCGGGGTCQVVDLNLRSRAAGKLALDFAVQRNHLEAAQALLLRNQVNRKKSNRGNGGEAAEQERDDGGSDDDDDDGNDGVDFSCCRDVHGATVLHTCVVGSRVDMLKLLLPFFGGADCPRNKKKHSCHDNSDMDNQNVVIGGSSHDHANNRSSIGMIDSTDMKGNTPLHLTIDHLVQQRHFGTVLPSSTAMSDTCAMLELFVASGADLYTQQRFTGDTPLHTAIAQYNLLLENVFNVKFHQDGACAIDAAAVDDDWRLSAVEQIIHTLHTAGCADCIRSVKNTRGRTAIDLAAFCESILLRHEATNDNNVEGWKRKTMMNRWSQSSKMTDVLRSPWTIPSRRFMHVMMGMAAATCTARSSRSVHQHHLHCPASHDDCATTQEEEEPGEERDSEELEVSAAVDGRSEEAAATCTCAASPPLSPLCFQHCCCNKQRQLARISNNEDLLWLCDVWLQRHDMS